jgi:hypothetical protein
MMTKDEWSDWATSYSTQQFIQRLEIKIRETQQEAMGFTNPDTVVKDYFFAKGVCDGIYEAIGVINDLKRSNK